MALQKELMAYKDRWALVKERVQAERLNASPELRWRQLNAAYQIGRTLGLERDETGEMLVFEQWARLKNLLLEA